MSISFKTVVTLSSAALFTAASLVWAQPGNDAGQFRLLREAPLPEGFPEVTPVGEIEVKQLPAYRMAQSTTSSGGSFWTLFTHIKRNDIAMTAPVQLDMEVAENGVRQVSMAFLYGDSQLGSSGSQGNVEVVDVPPTTVLSIGVRGEHSRERIALAIEKLSSWLGEQSQYEAAGPPRVMAYNSPFVSRDRKYFEVQIPLRPHLNQ